ncbi:MAG: hypothetical protein IJK22_04450 [Bacteroidales bacterium]|nr:hypothetical protein [Bacteroidales bacterium]
MRFNQKYDSIGDLKAETWMNTYLPDNVPVRVSSKGIFYSNYCEDLLEVDTSAKEVNVSLSRDGLFHLLPEALFVDENYLRDPKRKHKPFTPEKERILNFFTPFDSEYFQVTLGLDRVVQNFESDLVDVLLKSLYDIDAQAIQNPEVKKALPLLLQASEIRGDYVLIGRLMTAITGFHAQIQRVFRTFPDNAGNEYETVVARIVFYIPSLTNTEYSSLYDELGGFVQFIAEWFFPVEQAFEYAIKEEGRPFVLDGTLTLDYNTYL